MTSAYTYPVGLDVPRQAFATELHSSAGAQKAIGCRRVVGFAAVEASMIAVQTLLMWASAALHNSSKCDSKGGNTPVQNEAICDAAKRVSQPAIYLPINHV